MPLSAQDLALFRESQTHTVNLSMNIVPANVVATATISATPSVYPIGSVSVSGTSVNWNSIQVGMLFRITDSSDNHVTYGVVRLAPTANTFYMDAKSRGDAGISTEFLRAIQSGDTLTVYDTKPMWTLLSRIKDGVFYKKYDVPYDGSGSTPFPVANMCNHKSVMVKSGGTYTLSLNASDSFAWNGASITTYSWSIPITSGYSITSGAFNTANAVVELDEGYHRILLTITDSNGRSTTGERHVFVNSESSPDLSRSYGITIDSDSQDLKGRSIGVTIYGDFDESQLILGGMAVIGTNPLYDGQEVESEYLVDTFAGFITDYSVTLGDEEKKISVTIESPYALMDKIPMVSQVIVEVPSPNSWEEVSEGLGTVDFLGWYILYHHCTFLRQFNFYISGDGSSSPRQLAWGLNGSTISQFLETIANFIGGNYGCASDGSLYLRRNPSLESTTYRNNVENLITWGEDDIEENPDVSYAYFNRNASVRVYGLVRNNSSEEGVAAYGSIAPGNQQGQAGGSEQYEGIALKIGEGQDRVNELSGHYYAMGNRPIDNISLTIVRNMDVFDPPRMIWNTISVPADTHSRVIPINTRVTINSVSRGWELSNDSTMVVTLSVTFTPESFGQPGVTLPIEEGGGGPEVTTIVEPPNIFEKKPENIITESVLNGFVIAIDTDGNIGRTFDGKNWQRINGGISNFYAVSFDYNPNNSTMIANNFQSGKLGMYAIIIDNPDVSNGNTLKIYYSDDVASSSSLPEWTLLHTQVYTNPITASIASANDGSGTDIGVAVNDGRGTAIIGSVNSGSTWSAYRLGTEVDLTSTPANNAPIAITTTEGDDEFWTTAYDGNKYDIYSGGTITSLSSWDKYNEFNFDRPANNIQVGFDISDNEEPIGYISWKTNTGEPDYEGYLIPFTHYYMEPQALDGTLDTVYVATHDAPGNQDLDSGLFIEPTIPNLLSEDYAYYILYYGKDGYYISDHISMSGNDITDAYYGDPILNIDGSTYSLEWDNTGLIAGDTYEAGLKILINKNQGGILKEVFFKYEFNALDAANPSFNNSNGRFYVNLLDKNSTIIDSYEIEIDGINTFLSANGEINTSDISAIGLIEPKLWETMPIINTTEVHIKFESEGDGLGFFPRLNLKSHPGCIAGTFPRNVEDATMYIKFFHYRHQSFLPLGRVVNNLSDEAEYNGYGINTTDEALGSEGLFDENGMRKASFPTETVYFGTRYDDANKNGTIGVQISGEDDFYLTDTDSTGLKELWEHPSHLVKSFNTNITNIILASDYYLEQICDRNYGIGFEYSGYLLTPGDNGYIEIEFARETIASGFIPRFIAFDYDPLCTGWNTGDIECKVELLDSEDNVIDSLQWQFYIVPDYSSDHAIAIKKTNPADTRISIMSTYDWNYEAPPCNKAKITMYNNSTSHVVWPQMEYMGIPYLGEATNPHPTSKIYKFQYKSTIELNSTDITPEITLGDNGLFTNPRRTGPNNNYALSMDYSNKNIVNMIGTDGSGTEKSYMKSNDYGISYTISKLTEVTANEEPTYNMNKLNCIIQSGNLALVWGIDNIGFFYNGDASNFTSIVGNWRDIVFNGTTEWRQAVALF